MRTSAFFKKRNVCIHLTWRGASTAPFQVCVWIRKRQSGAVLPEKSFALKSAIYFNSHPITRVGVGGGRNTAVQQHYRHVNAGKWASLNVFQHMVTSDTSWIYASTNNSHAEGNVAFKSGSCQHTIFYSCTTLDNCSSGIYQRVFHHVMDACGTSLGGRTTMCLGGGGDSVSMNK